MAVPFDNVTPPPVMSGIILDLKKAFFKISSLRATYRYIIPKYFRPLENESKGESNPHREMMYKCFFRRYLVCKSTQKICFERIFAVKHALLSPTIQTNFSMHN